jgi:hypothetical protein
MFPSVTLIIYSAVIFVCRPYQLLVVNSKGKTRDTKEWVHEVFKYRGDSTLLREFEQWNVPRFPLNGNMLKEEGVPGEWHVNNTPCIYSLKLIHTFEFLKIQSSSLTPKCTLHSVFFF